MYYGMLLVNEAIGSTQATKRVAELGCLHRHIVAYGIYEDDQLARMVLINTQVYCNGSQERKNIEVSLDFLPAMEIAYSVKRLRLPHTQAHHDM